MNKEIPVFPDTPVRKSISSFTSGTEIAQEENGQIYMWEIEDKMPQTLPESWRTLNKQAPLFPTFGEIQEAASHKIKSVFDNKTDRQLQFWQPNSLDEENKPLFKKALDNLVPTGNVLLTAFFASELLDTIITEVEFNVIKNGTEVNPAGMGELYYHYPTQDLIALKLGISAAIIIAYGLTSIHERESKFPLLGTVNYKRVAESALQLGTLLQAGVLSWDAINFIPDAISKITRS